jgi:Zn-dependent alcohol dehydrogenase
VRHTRIIVTHYGGPDALRVIEEECPEPKDGEVRVRVLAAGVSLLSAGMQKSPTMGTEFSPTLLPKEGGIWDLK